MGNFTSQVSGNSGPTPGALVDGNDGAGALAKGVVIETNAVATITTEAPKKKICCACPETKKLRDECVVEHGQDACEVHLEYDWTQGHPVAQLEHARHAMSEASTKDKSGGAAAAT